MSAPVSEQKRPPSGEVKAFDAPLEEPSAAPPGRVSYAAQIADSAVIDFGQKDQLAFPSDIGIYALHSDKKLWFCKTFLVSAPKLAVRCTSSEVERLPCTEEIANLFLNGLYRHAVGEKSWGTVLRKQTPKNLVELGSLAHALECQISADCADALLDPVVVSAAFVDDEVLMFIKLALPKKSVREIATAIVDAKEIRTSDSEFMNELLLARIPTLTLLDSVNKVLLHQKVNATHITAIADKWARVGDLPRSSRQAFIGCDNIRKVNRVIYNNETVPAVRDLLLLLGRRVLQSYIR